MDKVSIKGILIGAVVILSLDFVGAIALVFALGGAPLFKLPQEEQAAALDAFSLSMPYLAGAMVIGLLTTVLGGYLAARIAKREAYLNSGLLGVVGIVVGAALASGSPVWFNVVSFLLIIPASLLGGHLAKCRYLNA